MFLIYFLLSSLFTQTIKFHIYSKKVSLSYLPFGDKYCIFAALCHLFHTGLIVIDFQYSEIQANIIIVHYQVTLVYLLLTRDLYLMLCHIKCFYCSLIIVNIFGCNQKHCSTTDFRRNCSNCWLVFNICWLKFTWKVISLFFESDPFIFISSSWLLKTLSCFWWSKSLQ